MIKNFDELVVGSVVSRVDKNRLIHCPLAKPVGFSFGVPVCICDLGFGVCPRHGYRAKFRFCLDSFYVVSVCERLDNFLVVEK